MGKGVENRKIAVVLDQSPQALCMNSLSIALTPHLCHHGNIYITMATLVSPSAMYHNFLGFHFFLHAALSTCRWWGKLFQLFLQVMNCRLQL